MKSNAKWVLFYCVFSLVFLFAVQWGSDTVEVISQVRAIQPKHTIILDAGHGGEDGGTISGSGRLESDYNLEITLRLQDMLNLEPRGQRRLLRAFPKIRSLEHHQALERLRRRFDR